VAAKLKHRRRAAAKVKRMRRCVPAKLALIMRVMPKSTPRPRESGARMIVASGRDRSGERDDGSGSDGDGGGSGSDPPPALACDIAGRAL